jgi:hypothetical protein
MSGSVRLTEEEKMEMLADARDPARRAAFAAAQGVSHHGTLDDYIDFFVREHGYCRRNGVKNHEDGRLSAVSGPKKERLISSDIRFMVAQKNGFIDFPSGKTQG